MPFGGASGSFGGTGSTAMGFLGLSGLSEERSSFAEEPSSTRCRDRDDLRRRRSSTFRRREDWFSSPERPSESVVRLGRDGRLCLRLRRSRSDE